MNDTTPPSSDIAKIRPLRVLRDIAILYGLTMLGGFVIGLTTSLLHQANPMVYIALSNIFLTIGGFAFAGYCTSRKRWLHLFLVAIGLWLTGLPNLVLGFSVSQWLASSIVIFISMGIGGGIACLLKKSEP